MPSSEIVVGFDGSEVSLAATRWAAREASLRGAPLRIVLAYELGRRRAKSATGPAVRKAARQLADIQVATAVDAARAVAPDLSICSQTVWGKPGPTLLETTRLSALLVVGNRGHGGFVNLLLGSVSQQVATHADTGVAVVRGRVDATAGPVAVGVDSSASTEHILDVAFQEAAARGTTLVVIKAHESPVIWSTQPYIEHVLAEVVAPWHDRYPDVKVETLVAKGSAAEALIEASETAQLVVVGTRGHGGFTGLLLGSVGQQLLHHARSPVLIARTHTNT
jgi:nucleotide-binding universal stress UspA family protein